MGHVQDDFQPGSGKLGIDGSYIRSDTRDITLLIVTAHANNGGIIGRGVLLDWADWAGRSGIRLSPFQTGAIELAHLKAIVAEHGIQFRQGDILFIRCGFTAAYNALSAQDRHDFPDRQPGGLLGLEATCDSLRWLWDNSFAAVAGDAMGFERGPATGPYNDPDVSIHQWALRGWGMPIGEMFDLEALAEACRRRNRWTFFLTSVPLKVSQVLRNNTKHRAHTNRDRSLAALQVLEMQWPSYDLFQRELALLLFFSIATGTCTTTRSWRWSLPCG